MLEKMNERIAYYRRACGMTQEELAEKCSVSPQAVSKWENDLTAPDISLLPRLSEIFGVTTDELLGVAHADTVAVAPAAFDTSKAILRVRIKSDEGDTVSINLPLEIAKIVLQSGSISFDGNMNALKDIDFDAILALVHAGAIGKLVEVHSADGDDVEIWVE